MPQNDSASLACLVPHCGRVATRRGLCETCSSRLRREGRLEAVGPCRRCRAGECLRRRGRGAKGGG